MSDLDPIMLNAIRYRSGEGYGQSVEDRAWLLRYIERQPAVLLRDTPEDARLLAAAILPHIDTGQPMTAAEWKAYSRKLADAIMAALRGPGFYDDPNLPGNDR